MNRTRPRVLLGLMSVLALIFAGLALAAPSASAVTAISSACTTTLNITATAGSTTSILLSGGHVYNGETVTFDGTTTFTVADVSGDTFELVGTSGAINVNGGGAYTLTASCPAGPSGGIGGPHGPGGPEITFPVGFPPVTAPVSIPITTLLTGISGEGYVESSDGECLDVANAFGSRYAGARLQEWACGALGGEDQQFIYTNDELEYVIGTTPTGYCVADSGYLEPCGAADVLAAFTGSGATLSGLPIGLPVGCRPYTCGLAIMPRPRGFIPFPTGVLALPETEALGQFGQYLFEGDADAALAVAGSSGEGARVGAVLGAAADTSTLSADTLWSLPEGGASSLPFAVAPVLGVPVGFGHHGPFHH